MMAVFGWTDPRMPSVYTKAANKKKLSRSNATLLSPVSDSGNDVFMLAIGDENKRSLPAPLPRCGESVGKTKTDQIVAGLGGGNDGLHRLVVNQ